MTDKMTDFGSQTSLGRSTQGNDPYNNRETGSTDQFGVVRTISKTTNGSNQSKNFVIMTNLEVRPGKNRNTGPCPPPADPEADYGETSRQRSNTRVSTITKLPGTDCDAISRQRRSIEEALTSIVDSIGEQNEQMSLRLGELDRAFHVERKSLREEIDRHRQEVSRSNSE